MPPPAPERRPISLAQLQAIKSGSTPFDPSTLDRSAILAGRARVLGRMARYRPPITRFLSVPRAIPLGPSRRVVSELRLRHLAELQAFLEEVEPHPLDGMPPAWADPDPGTRLARLRVADKAAESWPPRLGTARASEILGGPGGRAFFLALCLGEHDPSFGLGEALALLPEITPAQWSGLLRVAWAKHPRQEIAEELAPDRSGDSPGDWPRNLHLAAGEHAALAYPNLGELTLSQWRSLCNEGKAMEVTKEYSSLLKRAKAALESPDE